MNKQVALCVCVCVRVGVRAHLHGSRKKGNRSKDSHEKVSSGNCVPVTILPFHLLKHVTLPVYGKVNDVSHRRGLGKKSLPQIDAAGGVHMSRQPVCRDTAASAQANSNSEAIRALLL